MRAWIRSVMIAGGLAMVVGVLPASAQVFQPVTFKTTFPFMVGRATLPAGSYTVRPVFDGDGSLLEVRGDGGAAIFFGENAGVPRVDTRDSVVVFDHSGDRYVLSEIWDETNREGTDKIPARLSEPEKGEKHQAKH
jgi:hypothetical protein